MEDDQETQAAAPAILRAEHFEPFVGRDVRFGDTGVALVLVEVERAGKESPAGIPRTPFVLIFSGPKVETYLSEGLYRCDFGAGETFDIHVAPIHTHASDRQDYQAVFS